MRCSATIRIATRTWCDFVRGSRYFSDLNDPGSFVQCLDRGDRAVRTGDSGVPATPAPGDPALEVVERASASTVTEHHDDRGSAPQLSERRTTASRCPAWRVPAHSR